MSAKEITVLMVEPGKHPKVTILKDDLDSLQKAVSIGADYQGLIEFVSLRNGDCIMCNEEGKLIGLEGNRRLGDDILVGVFYIMSENEDGELISLTDRKIKHYTSPGAFRSQRYSDHYEYLQPCTALFCQRSGGEDWLTCLCVCLRRLD